MSVENNIDIQGLSQSERILLAEELWDSVASDLDKLEVTEAQKKILEARLTAYQADPEVGSSWESIKDEMN